MLRGERMFQRRAVFLLSILLVPLLSGIFAPSFGSASAAIDDCQGTLSPIVWNETISRHAEVPFNDYWDPFYYEEDWDDDGGLLGMDHHSPPPAPKILSKQERRNDESGYIRPLRRRE